MRKLIVLLLWLFIAGLSHAQNNTGIGTTTPNVNALLELQNSGNPLGLLLPRQDIATFTLNPADAGMMVFNTTDGLVYTWDGSNWIVSSGVTGSGTINRITYWNTGSTISAASNLAWDNANEELAIGFGIPEAALHINRPSVADAFVKFTNSASFVGAGNGLEMGLSAGNDAILRHYENGAMRFYTNNAERITIRGAGPVGIGNTAPLAQLSVSTASNLAFQLDGSSNVGTWLSINNSGTGGEWFHMISTATGNGDAGELSFYTGSDGGTATGLIMSLNHANQNVGIGRSQAWAPLHFATNTANRKIVLWQAADNDHEYYGFGVNANTLRYQVPNTVDNHIFYAGTSATTSNELMRITGTGSVGIGTASPFSTLSVNGSITVDHGDANVGDFQTGLKFGSGNTGEVIASNRSAGVNQFGIDFYTGYANRMAITSLGNVGLGTSNPLSRLEVNGDIRLTNGTTRSIIMSPEPNSNDAQSLIIKASDATAGAQARNGGSLILDGGHNYNISIAGSRPGHIFLRSGGNLFTGGNSPPGDIYFQSGGVSVAANSYTNRAIIRGSDGFMGIGLIAPAFQLHVNGFVGGFSFINTSDERLKKEIEPIDNALNKIVTLDGVSYKWNKDVDPSMNVDDNRHLGFLAQDVEKVLPEIVHTADDAMKTKRVEYSSIIPVLVEAMKEQQIRIEALEAQLNNR